MLPMLRDERNEERLFVARRVFGDLVQRHVGRLALAA
jgi:hypothetical protein